MILEESLDADLKSAASILAYTGSTGIFYQEADAEYDGDTYLVYKKAGEDYMHNNKNVVWDRRHPKIEFTSYSKDRFNSRKLTNAIVARYKDFRGVLGGGVTVIEIEIDSDLDLGRIDERYSSSVELIIKYDN